jgi:hypothetical protein
MSDLQCPARLLLLCAPDAGTVETLRHERVAAVYDGPPGSGADALAEALGLPVQGMARTLSTVDVLAQDPDAMDALRELADIHRGETVVITAVGAPGQRVDVALDGDGITVVEVSPGAGT